MTLKIDELTKQIDELNRRLSKEYAKTAKKYGFFVKKDNKVEFTKEARQKNKQAKLPLYRYVMPKNLRHLLSAPFIYSMIIPTVIFDIFLWVYHSVAFPLYGIPKVKRSDYIIFDRKELDYLNLLQKINCLYCSYVNGFVVYLMEIAARTERYWCPIKAAKKPKFHHSWYHDFADYGNPKQWQDKFNQPDAFNKLKAPKS